MSQPEEPEGPQPPYLVIAYEITSRIKTGELKPGDRVPSVTELANSHGVSHGTARRALAMLKAWGMTETVPGYATFVKRLIGMPEDQTADRVRRDAPTEPPEPS